MSTLKPFMTLAGQLNWIQRIFRHVLAGVRRTTKSAMWKTHLPMQKKSSRWHQTMATDGPHAPGHTSASVNTIRLFETLTKPFVLIARMPLHGLVGVLL